MRNTETEDLSEESKDDEKEELSKDDENEETDGGEHIVELNTSQISC